MLRPIIEVAEHAKKATEAFKGVNLKCDKSVNLKSVTDKLKKGLGVTNQSTSIGTTTNNDFSTTSKTISAGGKNAKFDQSTIKYFNTMPFTLTCVSNEDYNFLNTEE